MVLLKQSANSKMELEEKEIERRQELFCSTVRSHFMLKISKYRCVLLKTGLHVSDNTTHTGGRMSRSQSFEEHVELVIGQGGRLSPVAYKSLWKIGNRISATRVFRWIYDLLQRSKATQILKHLDGIPDAEMCMMVLTVAKEIAVAYEYQICLLAGDYEVVQLGQHAALCMLAYLNTPDAHFGPEQLLQAIIEMKPQTSRNRELMKTRPVLFNGGPVCLKWRLSQILKQTGLRISCDYSEVAGKPVENDGENIADDAGKYDELDSDGKTGPDQENAALDEVDCAVIVEDVDSVKLTRDNVCKADNVSKSDKKVTRTIKAIEMNYDEGYMKVTDHEYELSDFSPLEQSVPPFEHDADDKTSIDGDFSSDIDEAAVEELGEIPRSEVLVSDPLKSNVKDDVPGDPQAISTDSIPKSHTNGESKEQLKEENIAKSGELDNEPEAELDVIEATVHIAARPDKTQDIDDNTGEKYGTKNRSGIKTKHSELNAYTNYIDPIEDEDNQNVPNQENNSQKLSNRDIKTGNRTGYRFYGCFTPYGAKCRPQIYGYRGPLHVLNESNGEYSLIYNDTVTIATLHKRELANCSKDVHQSYSPKTKCDH